MQLIEKLHKTISLLEQKEGFFISRNLALVQSSDSGEETDMSNLQPVHV